MIGFVIGTVALVGLIRVIARGRAWRGRRAGFERGVRGPLRALFARLDTTPGQERVIADAIAEARGSLRDSRGELKASRNDLVAALRADHFDPLLLEGTFSRHDERLTAMRAAMVGALARVHEALDPAQRERLAGLVRNGFAPLPVAPREMAPAEAAIAV